MTRKNFPSDDLPPGKMTDLDVGLREQLEDSICQRFFSSCDGSTQLLLTECTWTIQVLEALTLVIHCPSQTKVWHILNHIATLASQLSQFSPNARIKVYPPLGEGVPFDMRVDERSVYRGT